MALPLRAFALTIFSGLLLVGAFPHLDWGGLAWVALVPFLRTFPQSRLQSALGLGLTLGLVFFGGLLYWIGVFAGHVIGPGLATVTWLGAALLQTVTLVLFAGGAYCLRALKNVWAWRLGVPALWTVLEWTRQLGIFGMGWGDLAYTQHLALPILQLTKLTGVWGLSFLIVLVNVAVAEGLAGRRWTRFTSAVALIVLVAVAFGESALHTEHLRPDYKAAALQGNINQNVTQSPAYRGGVMQTFSALGQKAAAQGAVLTVWPETAFPGYLHYDGLLAQMSRDAVQNRQIILVGAMDQQPGETKPSNTLFLVSPRGQIRGSYAKQHLVPFGEYVPYRQQFPWLERLHLAIYDEAPGGPDQRLLDSGTPVGKIGAAICYDSTYGPLMRAETASGANLLVVSTDDTWFGRTAAARQHAAMAAVRAAENDRYLVRSAATGISQIIAPTGQVLGEADLFQSAAVVAPVQSRATRTLYVRGGDWFVVLCTVLLAGLIGLSARGSGTSRSSGR